MEAYLLMQMSELTILSTLVYMGNASHLIVLKVYQAKIAAYIVDML